MKSRSPFVSTVALFVLLGACSAAPSTDRPGTDAGGTGDGAVPPDAAHADGAADATSSDGGGDAAATVDGGPCAVSSFARCPQPPAGFTRCGGGAIDPAAARTACDAVDPPLDLGMGLMKSCAAFTVTSGHYEVWCSAGEVYVWASFDELASSDILHCPFSVPLPDGGTLSASTDQLSWGLSDTNGQLYSLFMVTGGAGRAGGMLSGRAWPDASSDRATDASHWTGSVAVDGRLSVGAGVTGGRGNVFLTAAQTDCRSVPTSAGFRIVLAVPVTWP